MFTNLNPGIVFIADKYVNVENLSSYDLNSDKLFIVLNYLSGDKDILRFETVNMFNKAVSKLKVAERALNFGTIYG